MQYQLLREHKVNVKTACGCAYKGCILSVQKIGIGNRPKERQKIVKRGDD